MTKLFLPLTLLLVYNLYAIPINHVNIELYPTVDHIQDNDATRITLAPLNIEENNNLLSVQLTNPYRQPPLTEERARRYVTKLTIGLACYCFISWVITIALCLLIQHKKNNL